jgi:hypothetical protein
MAKLLARLCTALHGFARLCTALHGFARLCTALHDNQYFIVRVRIYVKNIMHWTNSKV